MHKDQPTNPNPSPEQVLAAPMEENDAKASTIRDYLVELLLDTWRNPPKRPWGTSGWITDLDRALGRAGFIHCEVDGDGYLVDADRRATEKLITSAIESFKR